MYRKSLPYSLKGYFSFIKNKIKKKYKNDVELLKTDNEWYQNVIIESENHFDYLHSKDFVPSELRIMVEYLDTIKLSKLREIYNKYGEINYYFIALEYLIIPIYERAYEKALKEPKKDEKKESKGIKKGKENLQKKKK